MSQPIVTTEPDDMPDDMAEGEGAPNIDQLLDSFMGKTGGWPDMDTATIGKLLNKQTQQQHQAMRNEAQAFRECFSTPAGMKVLKLMMDETVNAITWPVAGLANGQDMLAFGCWREGQNAMMANIIQAIALANNQNVKPRSTP